MALQLRRGTAGQWTAANPVLAVGEPGVETDTRKTKYGDGVTAWSALPYDAADNVVQLTGAQTAAGVKTFSSSPIIPTPGSSLAAATKAYVDESVGSIPAATDLASIPAFIQETGGVYAARSTVTSSSTRMVLYKGPATNPPPIGGTGGAINGVDVWFAGAP